MHPNFRRHVARLLSKLGIVEHTQLEPHLDDAAQGSLARALLEAGLLERETVDRVYATLHEALLRSDPHAPARRADNTLGKLAVEKRMVARERVLEVVAERQQLPAAERPPLAETLVAAGALDEEQLANLRRLHGLLYASCDVCGEVALKSELPDDCPRCGWPRAHGRPDRDTARPEAIDDAADLVDPFLGQTLGGCQLCKRLGAGGMGAVYLGYHEPLGREVAVKVLPHTLAVDAVYRERFLREARTAARLDHPGIVRVYDVGNDGATFYMIQELVEGRSLQARLDADGPLPRREALDAARQVAVALAAAHGSGLMHRDIKPDNLLQTPEGQVKLADFGLARDVDDTGLSLTGSIAGTPAYMAPEQIEARDVDTRADIYALGVTLYALLRGASPFERGALMTTLAANTSEPLPALGAPRLDPLLAGMTHKSPDQRTPTAEAVIEAIDAVLSGKPESPAHPARRGSAERPAVQRRTRASDKRKVPAAAPQGASRSLLLGLAAVALLALGFTLLPRGSGHEPAGGADSSASSRSAIASSDPTEAIEAWRARITAPLEAGDIEAALRALVEAPPAASEAQRAEQRQRVVARARAAFLTAGRARIASASDGDALARLELEALPDWGLGSALDEARAELRAVRREALGRHRRSEADRDWQRELERGAELLASGQLDEAAARWEALARNARFEAQRGIEDPRWRELQAVAAVERAWRAALEAPRQLRWGGAEIQSATRQGDDRWRLALRIDHAGEPEVVERSLAAAAVGRGERLTWAARRLTDTAGQQQLAAYRRLAGQSQRLALPPLPPGFERTGRNAQGHQVAEREDLGLRLVWIPAATTRLGRERSPAALAAAFPGVPEAWFAEEPPATETPLPGFWIGAHEVTRAQYRRFLQANADWQLGGAKARELGGAEYLSDWRGLEPPAGTGDHPVVWISHHAAAAYARWASLELPDAARWQRAASGPLALRYPWGDRAGAGPATIAAWRASFFEPWRGAGQPTQTRPVGSDPRDVSAYGSRDMAGSVREWLRASDERYAHAGGAWDGGAWEARACSQRPAPSPLATHPSLGFRVAFGGARR